MATVQKIERKVIDDKFVLRSQASIASNRYLYFILRKRYYYIGFWILLRDEMSLYIYEALTTLFISFNVAQFTEGRDREEIQ